LFCNEPLPTADDVRRRASRGPRRCQIDRRREWLASPRRAVGRLLCRRTV